MKYLSAVGAALAPLIDRHTVAANRAYVSEDTLCLRSGGGGRHPSRDQIPYSHLEMKEQLVVHRRGDIIGAQAQQATPTRRGAGAHR